MVAIINFIELKFSRHIPRCSSSTFCFEVVVQLPRTLFKIFHNGRKSAIFNLTKLKFFSSYLSHKLHILFYGNNLDIWHGFQDIMHIIVNKWLIVGGQAHSFLLDSSKLCKYTYLSLQASSFPYNDHVLQLEQQSDIMYISLHCPGQP